MGIFINPEDIVSFKTRVAPCGNAPCAITLSFDNYSLLHRFYNINEIFFTASLLLDCHSHLTSHHNASRSYFRMGFPKRGLPTFCRMWPQKVSPPYPLSALVYLAIPPPPKMWIWLRDWSCTNQVAKSSWNRICYSGYSPVTDLFDVNSANFFTFISRFPTCPHHLSFPLIRNHLTNQGYNQVMSWS